MEGDLDWAEQYFLQASFSIGIHYVILSLWRFDKNIILSLIASRGTVKAFSVLHDNPIFQAFFIFPFSHC